VILSKELRKESVGAEQFAPSAELEATRRSASAWICECCSDVDLVEPDLIEKIAVFTRCERSKRNLQLLEAGLSNRAVMRLIGAILELLEVDSEQK